VKIVNLEEKHEETYFMCLEGWSSEMKEAGDHKENWYKTIKEKNYDLGVKLAHYSLNYSFFYYLKVISRIYQFS